MYLYQGKKITDTVIINDVQYPPNWWTQCSPDELTALGITEVPDPTPPDPTYYTYTENADGSYTDIPIPLASVQTAQAAQVSAACQAAIYAGFTSSALGAAYTYPFGDLDQTNLTGSVLLSTLPAASAPGWTIEFLCADSTGAWGYRAHTQAQIQQVGTDAANSKLANLVKNATKAAQINAVQPSANPTADIDAVLAITWSS